MTDENHTSEVDSGHRDLSFRELMDWAHGQAKHLAAGFRLDPGTDRAYFAMAQSVKLGEEVGELHAEVLGAAAYHRPDKAGRYTAATLAGEMADVAVCLALVASILGVDLNQAVTDKLEYLEQRRASTPA